MKHLLKATQTALCVSALALIAGCASTPSNNNSVSTNANAVNPKNTASVANTSNNTSIKFDSNWVNALESFKTPIRACLIKQKDTSVITYASNLSKEKAIVFLQNAQGQNYECVADLSKNAVDSIMPTANAPKNVPKLYPIGRKVNACKSPVVKKDSNNRVMGTICSA